MKRERRTASADGDGPLDLEAVRAIVRELPGTAEGPSYGTPGFRVGRSLFARAHQDGESLVVRIEPKERAMRMRADPETFFITDHYRDYPWVLVRLATVARDDLRDLLEDAWRLVAPKRLLAGRDGTPGQFSKRRSGRSDQ